MQILVLRLIRCLNTTGKILKDAPFKTWPFDRLTLNTDPKFGEVWGSLGKFGEVWGSADSTEPNLTVDNRLQHAFEWWPLPEGTFRLNLLFYEDFI